MPKPKAALIGRIAVHNKLITPDQLEEALREQGLPGTEANLGDILVAKGFLTPRQLAALVRAQAELVARERARRAAQLGAAAAPESLPQPASSASTVPAPAVAAPAAVVRRDASGTAELEALLRDAVQRGASDVHVHA